jgi:histidyl-tRNA synthetase
MAKEKPSIPKGTRDFGPQEVAKRKYILNTIEKVFIKYGFMPIETPTMENLSTLTGKYGDEGDKLLFKVLNSGDYLKEITPEILTANNQQLTTKLISEKGLRYDLTVPFARYVVMNRNEITFPFKRYQMQPVWRADRPQKGRYREFWQCDADVVGSDSLLNELDLIQIYAEVFKGLGVQVEIKINNRKILAGIAEVVKGAEHLQTIAVAIDKLDKIGEEGVSKELSALDFSDIEISSLFEIITTKGEDKEMLQSLKSKLQSSTEGLKGIEELEFVLNSLQQINKSVSLKIDFSLARGLSYYTGCIFEVAALEGTLKSSIGGGGRYDNLTGIFGLDGVSGVGISFGLDRIYDVLEELKLFPEDTQGSHTKVLFCYFDEASQAYALQGVIALRNVGIASQIYPDVVKKIGKQLDFANKLNILFAAVAGTDEIAQQKFMFKDLNESKQELLSIEEMIKRLKN